MLSLTILTQSPYMCQHTLGNIKLALNKPFLTLQPIVEFVSEFLRQITGSFFANKEPKLFQLFQFPL